MNARVPDATTRFTSRVDDYVRWRPTYPQELVTLLEAETGVRHPAHVADVGSGTGISTVALLDAGYEVFAIEPNAAMRSAAEKWLQGRAGFHSRSGTSSATGLLPASVELVVAAQAFHWFDLPQTRVEFQRILKPGGYVALIWNSRKLAGTPFLHGYEQLLLEHGIDYQQVRHENIDAATLHDFFGGPFQSRTLTNSQSLDREGFLGRLRSSSYAPGPDHPGYAAMQAAANQLFDAQAQAGCVVVEYDLQVFTGQLAPTKPH